MVGRNIDNVNWYGKDERVDSVVVGLGVRQAGVTLKMPLVVIMEAVQFILLV